LLRQFFFLHSLQESATLPSATADGKGSKGGRQKAPAKKATVNSCFAVCFLAADGKGSLPSAADGKEGGRQ
jgi:hypothetical protein